MDQNMKNVSMRYTGLQIALLTILLDAKNPVTLTDLEKKTYRNSGKHKPKRARPSIAACIRNTSEKIKLIQASIERKTPIGRGHEATYVLNGRKDYVRASLKAFVG